jgi:hypothetical protein
MNKVENNLNVLVCGSQKFDDKSFVFGMLDQFYSQTNCGVKRIFTSKFSGTCEFAREWVNNKNEVIHQVKKDHPNAPISPINLEDCTFDMMLLERNSSLYEQLDIPDFLLQNDPFYLNGSELIQKNKINLVLAFPNPQGVLGPATYNIKRFAKLAGIGDRILDCSEALQQLQIVRESELQMLQSQKPEPTGFVNKHPGKKF